MESLPTDERAEVLKRYAAGHIGTRDAIAAAGLDDDGDLIVALARNGLDFAKPVGSPRRAEHLRRAAEILQPLPRRGA